MLSRKNLRLHRGGELHLLLGADSGAGGHGLPLAVDLGLNLKLLGPSVAGFVDRGAADRLLGAEINLQPAGAGVICRAPAGASRSPSTALSAS